MRLFVETVGSGQPSLLLLHGWGLNGAIWDGVRDALAAHFTLHIVDLPGHGLSRDVPLTTIDAAADLLAAALPNPSHVMGWSIGGQFALTLAKRHPTLVHAVSRTGRCLRLAPSAPLAIPDRLHRAPSWGLDLCRCRYLIWMFGLTNGLRGTTTAGIAASGIAAADVAAAGLSLVRLSFKAATCFAKFALLALSAFKKTVADLSSFDGPITGGVAVFVVAVLVGLSTVSDSVV